jgi:hypothetical protein
MNRNRWRIFATLLMIISLPLTLLDSSGAGWFADADGWQGYEVLFVWPRVLLSYGIFFDYPMSILLFGPVLLSNCYLLVGMWLSFLPKFVHFAFWFMWVPATVMTWLGGGIFPAFWLLCAAWIISGVGPIFCRSPANPEKGTVEKPVE